MSISEGQDTPMYLLPNVRINSGLVYPGMQCILLTTFYTIASMCKEHLVFKLG